MSDNKKKQLGRGLDALFGEEDAPLEEAVAQADATPGDLTTNQLPISALTPGQFQPRRHFDQLALDDLADSIDRHGVLQPLLVRAVGDNEFEIIAGERRFRAAKQAGLTQVPVVIQTMEDEAALEIALIENLQRQDLSPIEEAAGYQRLMDEFGHTQAELAKGVGKSRSHIANTLRLLNLPESVQELIDAGELSAGHGRTLAGAENPEDLVEKVMDEELTVRATEKLVKQQKQPKKPGGKSNRSVEEVDQSSTTATTNPAAQSVKPSHITEKGAEELAEVSRKSPDILALETELSTLLGLSVEIDMQTASEGGKLTVGFDSLDELDDVLHRLSLGMT
jgi:ParB family chromosome partitioning protein